MWTDRRGLVVVLALSLLGNALLGGVVAGMLVGRSKEAQTRDRALVARSSVRTLSQDDRRQFMQAMAPYRDAIREAWRKHRSARAAAENDIAAPTFDRAKVAADFAQLRQDATQAQQSNHAGLVDALSGLSQSVRAALVQHDRAR